MSCWSVSPVFSSPLMSVADAASGPLPGLAAFGGERVPFLIGEAILLGAMGYYLVAWLLVGGLPPSNIHTHLGVDVVVIPV